MVVQRTLSFGGITKGVKWVIIATVGAYVLQNMSQTLETNLTLWYKGNEHFMLWQPFTYMFAHSPIEKSPGIFHLLFNMFAVWMFGTPYEREYGLKRFLQLYFISGVLTGVIYMLFINTALMGASAGVYALLLSYAYLWPNSVVYIWGIFPVKAKYLVIGLMVLGLIFALNPGSGDMVAHLGHLLGAGIGFIFLQLTHKKYNLFGSKSPKVSKEKYYTILPSEDKKRDKVVYKDEWVKERVDELLDKVSKKGIKSLTKKEKDFLDKVSMSYNNSNDNID